MSVFTQPGRHRVAVLVRPGLLPMEMGIVHRLFGQAASSEGSLVYEVATCTLEPGQVRTDTDVSLNVAHGLEALTEADTVVVPASDEDYAVDASPPSSPVVDAVGRLRADTRVASICTGSFVLAAAGILDGRRATTHWKSTHDFRQRYPAVLLDPDVLYTEDGLVLTSAGVASGIDLCLHMIRQDHGAAVANEIARRTVVAPHREGGQAQFIRQPLPKPRSSSTEASRTWALEHLDQQLTLRQLASQESMSVRTFTRRFRAEMGMSPLRWLAHQRIDRARRLLEETDLPVDRIAVNTGFGTGASLRQHFQCTLGVSPMYYRRTFRHSALCSG